MDGWMDRIIMEVLVRLQAHLVTSQWPRPSDRKLKGRRKQGGREAGNGDISTARLRRFAHFDKQCVSSPVAAGPTEPPMGIFLCRVVVFVMMVGVGVIVVCDQVLGFFRDMYTICGVQDEIMQSLIFRLLSETRYGNYCRGASLGYVHSTDIHEYLVGV